MTIKQPKRYSPTPPITIHNLTINPRNQVLDHLPEKGGQIHAIVFVNLMGFIQELLEILVNQEGDKKQMAAMLERILDPLAAVLIRRPQGLATKISYKEEAARRAWMKRFVEP